MLLNQTGWEVCALLPATSTPAPANASNCTSNAFVTAAPATIGNWVAATPALSGASSVTLTLPKLPEGKVVVRYAWSSAPFEYKQASLYVSESQYPAGPFIRVVTA
jgi:hypothetical protein